MSWDNSQKTRISYIYYHPAPAVNPIQVSVHISERRNQSENAAELRIIRPDIFFFTRKTVTYFLITKYQTHSL
jgi:hypothetical protein